MSDRRASGPHDQRPKAGGAVRRGRGLALALGLVLGLLALALGLRALREPRDDLVRIVGDRESLVLLLSERARRGPPPSAPPRLVFEPLREEEARALYPQLVGPAAAVHQWDPFVGQRLIPGLDRRVPFAEHPSGAIRVRTNALGLRMDRDPAPARPQLRVLVLGDSHTEGACENGETFSALLEERLRAHRPERTVEVLNGGRTGWSFYNYLGALECYRDLEPEVVVLVVYAGNDFFESLLMHHWFQRTTLVPPPEDPGPEVPNGVWTQWLRQLVHFARHPEERELALEAALLTTRGIAERCRERGIALVVALLPPLADVQPSYSGLDLAQLAEGLGLDAEQQAESERSSDRWIAALEAEGLAVLDLRLPFRASSERLYWPLDQHLDLAGNALVAAELEERLGL